MQERDPGEMQEQVIQEKLLTLPPQQWLAVLPPALQYGEQVIQGTRQQANEAQTHPADELIL
jgi:hypothetical protein